jgi:hypothetical protein
MSARFHNNPMTRLLPALLAMLLSTACAVATGEAPAAPPARHPSVVDNRSDKRTLKPFESLQELRQAMAVVTEARRVEHEKDVAKWRQECRAQAKSAAEAAMCSEIDPSTETVSVAAAVASPSSTNNQHAGVDEGDIVKRQGDLLIVLRRGRLFTIGLAGGQLEPLDIADAYGPDVGDPELDQTWYDELLVWEHTVVVIGYSYDRGGTEVGFFDLGENGDLQHRATYHLRSDDYYSRGNYASRLIGGKLFLFSSFRVPENTDPDAWLPAMRLWRARGSTEPFEAIAPIGRVFRPVTPLGSRPVVHTMVSCDLAVRSPACEATVLLGDDLTVYYASPSAAYAWTTGWSEKAPSRSLLYRLPFDGGPVSAIGVTGTPRDQFAFFEDLDEHVNVIVAHGHDANLLRLPLASFSDGSIDAPAWQYRRIARNLGDWLLARFVGPYVLVSGQTWQNNVRRVVITEWAGERTYSLSLEHGSERIEAIGTNAVVIGAADHSLMMTAIRLGGRPAIAGVVMQKDAFQAEDRSHAFFYREDAPETGLLALPIITMNPEKDDDPLEESARVLFVRNETLTFARYGTLGASPGRRIDDHCRVSCLDWYGNARPIFVNDRIFALLGYEIVEGRLGARGVEEVRRVGLMPRTAAVH